MNASAIARTRKGTGNKASLERVVDVLRARIVNHEYPPGAKLREHVLAEEFGVSRQRVREAFGVLQDRGLIERIPNRGAVVTRLEVDQVFELFAVREVLEGLAVRLATENADPASWDDLIAMFGAPAEEALERNDLDFYVECITLFRQRCISAADNKILADQLDSLYDRTKVLIRRLVLVPGRAKEGLRQHQAILAAMREGDSARAEDLKRDNIRSAREWFRNYQKYLL